MVKSDCERALYSYLLDLGNHKLENLGRKYAVIRKCNKYSFPINFQSLRKLGFEPVYMSSYDGKDELHLHYIGTSEFNSYDDAMEYLREM